MSTYKLVICHHGQIAEQRLVERQHYALRRDLLVHVARALMVGTIDFRQFTGLAGVSLKVKDVKCIPETSGHVASARRKNVNRVEHERKAEYAARR